MHNELHNLLLSWRVGFVSVDETEGDVTRVEKCVRASERNIALV